MRCLVVDDLHLMGRTVCGLLRGWANDVTLHTSPLKALGDYERNPGFDLILFDLLMPEMNGLELALRLNSVRPISDGGAVVPTMILMTALSRTGASGQERALLIRAFESGLMADILHKPLQRSNFRSCCHAAVAKTAGRTTSDQGLMRPVVHNQASC